MAVACALLDRSLDPGVHDTFIQYEKFRKTRSALTNVSQVAVGGLGHSIGAYEQNWRWISDVSTHSFWFTRFMAGLHKHVGDIRKQDEPITIEILVEVDRVLDHEWKKLDGKREQNLDAVRKVADMGAWFVVGFCTGMRGEEMPLIEFAGTAQSLKHLNEPRNYFNNVVSGRTKGV
jgi:hypothetical protein